MSNISGILCIFQKHTFQLISIGFILLLEHILMKAKVSNVLPDHIRLYIHIY